MFSDFQTLCVVLVPALPLAAALVTLLFHRLLGKSSHLPLLVGSGIGLAASLLLLLSVWQQVRTEHKAAVKAATAAGAHDLPHPKAYEKVVTLWTWANLPNALTQNPRIASGPVTDDAGVALVKPQYNLDISVSLRVDPLTSLMLATVMFIGLLVVIYSIGYMHDDPGYWRYFTYLGLFIFSMTMLVAASNFLLLYVFWEAVGVSSYLLIGFWYTKPSAAAAAKKAFLVNRIGDVGLALGIFLIWVLFGTLNYHDVLGPNGEVLSQGVLGASRLAMPASIAFPGDGFLAAIGLLLLIGACGKSAQFPLHTWLPDAMEGPTPVSALIHAATMVTAGVYLITRCFPLFVGSEGALIVVSVVGGFTALLAALMAMTQNDLKRVLAYSTVSQIGFMFLALGAGTVAGAGAAMFHLFTHAFFKALLFLGAGSVMHSMGNVIDMGRFGGLRKVMPTTHWTFCIGALGLAGVPLFAGFLSKDGILASVYEKSGVGTDVYRGLFWIALFTAMLTAFYSARAVFLTFYGPYEVPEEAGHHPHESPPVMAVPLMILAVLSIWAGGGLQATSMYSTDFVTFLGATPSLAWAAARETHAVHDADAHVLVAGLSIAASTVGILLAAYFYLGDRKELGFLGRFRPVRSLQSLAQNRFYLDEIYFGLIVWPCRIVAMICNFLDKYLVDGLVNLVVQVPVTLGSWLRVFGTGQVQFYGLSMLIGLLLLILASGILDT